MRMLNISVLILSDSDAKEGESLQKETLKISDYRINARKEALHRDLVLSYHAGKHTVIKSRHANFKVGDKF